MQFLRDTEFAANPLLAWIIAAATAVIVLGVLRLALRVVTKRLAVWVKRTEFKWDDLIVDILNSTKLLFLLSVAVYIGALALTLPPGVRSALRVFVTLAGLFQAGVWGSHIVGFAVGRYIEQRAGDGATMTAMRALDFVARVVMWSVILLLALDNLGVDVTGLMAGLGIGGIAVALALQSILGDLFGSLTIILDKPFVVGDFLIVDDHRGTVEAIGIKTTRIRSLSGEQLIFSNADLLSSRIHNYGNMDERRILFNIGVTYDTPREKLAMLPSIIREVIESQEKVRFDRAHFKEFGDFSLNFEIVYYVLAPDYATYIDTQQEINLKLYERFGEEEIDFAFPSQTLYLVKQGE